MTSDISNLPPVFHEGEDSLHKLLGIEKRLSELGKHVIRDRMPDQHREFFQQLRWVHVAAIDGLGHPWALIRAGDAGFMYSPDDRTLQMRSEPLPGEPGDLQLAVGSKIGIVGLEPSSRRRNRLNATIRNEFKNMLTLSVDQSYGNCPQYIRKRSMQPGTARSRAVVSIHQKLDQTGIEILERADTLYIASRARHLTNDPRFGVDINHRGGSPGFITILDDSTIIIPDYKGNNF